MSKDFEDDDDGLLDTSESRQTKRGVEGIGHNGANDQLRLFIERVERLEEEKKGMSEDIRDVYSEAKAMGYDPKIMRKIVILRKMSPEDRQNMQAVLETYLSALNME